LSRFVPLLLLVTANAVWGSSYVVAKVAMEELPPSLLAALRYTIAAIVLWLVVAARRTPLPPRSDATRLLLLGLFAVAGNGLLGYWGISLTTATDAALLIVGEVLFTMLLAVAVARERLTRPRGMGLVVGGVGVVVLVLGAASGASPTAPARPIGDLLILAGLALEAAYTVLGMRLTWRCDALVVLTLSITGSCLVWVPLLGLAVTRREVLHPLHAETYAGVLYLALVTSAACYFIWFAVVGRAGATIAAISLLAQPVVGAVLGIALLGDPVTPSTVIGGCCVLVSLGLAAIPRPAVVAAAERCVRSAPAGARTRPG
jgi:drug/metabolite transporter (DMT)-like permease